MVEYISILFSSQYVCYLIYWKRFYVLEFLASNIADQESLRIYFRQMLQ